MSDDSEGRPKVGYKQPPMQHRFQKGQSGNPRGGSRKARSIASHPMILEQAELWRDAGRELISVTIDGEVQRVPVSAVIAKRVMTDAARGKPTAMRLAATKLMQSEEALRESYKSGLSDALEMHEKAKREAARLRSLGQKDPVLIPHPDDFAYNPVTGEPSILGPIDEAQYDLMMKVLKGRDELREFVRRVREGAGFSSGRTAAMILRRLKAMDEALPPRLRMSSDEWTELKSPRA